MNEDEDPLAEPLAYARIVVPWGGDEGTAPEIARFPGARDIEQPLEKEYGQPAPDCTCVDVIPPA